MLQNVIELSRFQASTIHQEAVRLSRRRSRAARVLTAIEAAVTAVIGVCILFCMGLTITML